MQGCQRFAFACQSSSSMDTKMNHTCMHTLRLAMFYEDWRGVKKLLLKAKTLCDAGGDWERKNKLKVCTGANCIWSVFWRQEHWKQQPRP